MPLGEERKTVTILAADVTPDDLSDDPEARRAELRERGAAAESVLEEHGATVQSLGGGRLLAVFGVPAARDDDALRAARAAVALRSGARIGLATGEVVTGDPLVSGPPVEEAASLRDRAAAGQVLAGLRTWRLVRHATIGVLRDGAWALDAVDPDAEPLVRRLETPIVGRERELEQVVEAFERAVAGSRPHLVTVFGAPGVGKTRLAVECVERLASVATSAVGRCRAAAQGLRMRRSASSCPGSPTMISTAGSTCASSRMRTARNSPRGWVPPSEWGPSPGGRRKRPGPRAASWPDSRTTGRWSSSWTTSTGPRPPFSTSSSRSSSSHVPRCSCSALLVPTCWSSGRSGVVGV